ncbi:MAG TPA: phospho-sugar mutase [Mesotoga infera]|mgnify:FL=1|jgi:phosphoglucomutase|uniref:Phosphoglucomutase n=1 Tax=Mesotoga infera TaxID=1236046 RepID=A0A7Z7LD84_9BACT|nr:phospho-sugar mutase [Mesotoga infera]MBP8659510.1 phospho-sugar mutase [Mesotoga sp.]NLI05560.1 phospho-sugar mutase [Thermotogaceae bacterium]SSC11816.1 Phosphoglucomutase [Mesotoga infera]HON27414.1 phospho-sugar mutase [Mesotoga infera]HPD36780.1 phospho-sugar mutase [Mesotoga infera]
MRDNLAIEKEYSRWLKHSSGELLGELENLSAEDVKERFATDLEFGTGGMRGKLGAGTNMMNSKTVTRATLGFGKWILETSKKPSVVIAYDTRNKSLEFSEVAADVLSSMGIRVYLFNEPTPTPVLSYAVRELKASGGIVITASHNPSQYNGYKVYTSDGTQAVPEPAARITERVNESDFFEEYTPRKELIEIAPENILSSFMKTIENEVRSLCNNYDNMRLVYTPLHGTGNYPVYRVLSDLGHEVFRVEEQSTPDGNFPTVGYPNPEDPRTFEMALHLARERNCDMIIATDPDCDRMGLMVKHNGDFLLLNGNQTGSIMVAFILDMMERKLPDNPFIVKTIVTTDLVKKIASNYGVAVKETLTGFKFIGELIEKSVVSGGENFLFGFEESYGYLFGKHARDKDAVVAAALASVIGGFLKKKGETLYDYLEGIYSRYGYFMEDLVNKEYEGIEGKFKIDSIMKELREKGVPPMKGRKLIEILDYSPGIEGLPASDVISMQFEGDLKLIARPSGTEPKIKFYLMAKGSSREEARKNIDEMKELVEGIVGR